MKTAGGHRVPVPGRRLQSPGAPDEDTEGGFRHGGWQLPYSDDCSARRRRGHGRHRRPAVRAEDVREDGCLLAERAERTTRTAQHLNAAEIRGVEDPGGVDWQNYDAARRRRRRASRQPEGAIRQQHLGSRQRQPRTDADAERPRRRVLRSAVYPIVLGSGKRLFPEDDQVRSCGSSTEADDHRGACWLDLRARSLSGSASGPIWIHLTIVGVAASLTVFWVAIELKALTSSSA